MRLRGVSKSQPDEKLPRFYVQQQYLVLEYHAARLTFLDLCIHYPLIDSHGAYVSVFLRGQINSKSALQVMNQINSNFCTISKSIPFIRNFKQASYSSTSFNNDDKMQKLLINAHKHYDDGSYLESLQCAESMYLASPSNVDVLMLLIANHFQLRNLNESIFYAQQCLRVDVACAEAYVSIGNCLKEMKDLPSAVSFFQKAIRYNPHLSIAYSNLGLTFLLMGKAEEAINTLQVAISLDFSNCDALCNLAMAYKSQGRRNEAKTKLLEAICIDPTCAIAFNNLGVLFNSQGEFEQAVDCYEQALEISPLFVDSISNSGNALYNLAKERRDEDTIQKAKERFERALELRPDFAVARGCYGTFLLETSGMESIDGARHLRMSILQDETCFDAMNNMAALYFGHGAFDDALKLCLRVLKNKPSHWCAYINFGNVLKAKGMLQAAALSYHVALELNDKIASPLSSLGTVLIAHKREKESIIYSQRAIDLDPSLISANTNMGVAYLSLGRLEEAETYILQGVVGFECEYNLAVMCQRKGDLKESMTHAIKAMDKVGRYSHQTKPIARFLDFLKLSVCDWSSDVFMMPQVVDFEPFEPLSGSNSVELPSYLPNDDIMNFDTTCELMQDATNLNHGILTVGYVCYHDHLGPTFTKVPQLHDSSRFKVFCYKIGFHEDERTIANKVINDGIQILVYTTELLPSRFCKRLAPVQVATHYSGYRREDIDLVVSPVRHDGISEAKTMDISDVYFEPAGRSEHNNEQNDLRADYGICHDVFLYGCFQQPQFIDPLLFDSWMRLLKNTDGTGILLVRHNDQMEINLKQRASEIGIESDRIVFIEFHCTEDYLKSFSIIDLYLDCRIQSGRSAIWNALIAGTPCICFQGSTPQTRSGASILSSIGLDNLVVNSLQQYETLGTTLQSDENRFINIVKKIDRRLNDQELGTVSIKWIHSFEREIMKYFVAMGTTTQHRAR